MRVARVTSVTGAFYLEQKIAKRPPVETDLHNFDGAIPT